jgi:hypothetical protein
MRRIPTRKKSRTPERPQNLSEECGKPGSFQPELTKAEASKLIDALKSKRSPQ